jgi:hypothetical protein
LRACARHGIRSASQQDRLMPDRQPRSSKTGTASFRARYDGLEQRRADLIARLAALGERARQHPGHARAHALLNARFRNATLVQRAAVLEAADWLIVLIDRATVLL